MSPSRVVAPLAAAAIVVTLAGCGHAPGLNVPEQIAIVRDFLAT